MSRLILLDAGPLSLAAHPRESEQAQRCKAWLRGLLAAGVSVMVPSVALYEVRRELLRAGRLPSVDRLDALAEALGVLSLSPEVLRTAAQLWARARQGGFPTAPDHALDADAILGAQALHAADRCGSATVATTNVRHLERFCDAAPWEAVGVD